MARTRRLEAATSLSDREEVRARRTLFIFTTPSIGGHIAVSDLCKTYAKRAKKGLRGLPIVRLGATDMPTKAYGIVPRPDFIIEGWDDASGGGGVDRNEDHRRHQPRRHGRRNPVLRLKALVTAVGWLTAVVGQFEVDMAAYHDPTQLAKALGGEFRNGQILAPGPGHSATDRSLSIQIDANAPHGFVVHSFAQRRSNQMPRLHLRARRLAGMETKRRQA